MENPEGSVPDDLWPDILARLSVRCLLRFRCVSKQWKALIDDPTFVRSHLRLSNIRSETHFVDWEGEPFRKKKLKVRCFLSFRGTFSPHVPLSIFNGNWYASSSIDGLFMLHTRYQSMLWNPATRKTLILPPSPEFSDPFAVDTIFTDDLGLGFDPSINNYKHVRVFYSSEGLHSVAVYSLATNSWKMIRCTLQRFPYLHRIGSGLCLKGFLFRLASTDLVSFDLKSEILASIPLPVVNRDVGDPALSVVDDGNSLALVYFSRGSGSLWVLEGFGDAEIKSCTWSKRHTFSSKIPDSHAQATWGDFLYLMKNGELLIQWETMVTSYNVKTHKEKVLHGKRLRYKALPYAQSLLAIPKCCTVGTDSQITGSYFIE